MKLNSFDTCDFVYCCEIKKELNKVAQESSKITENDKALLNTLHIINIVIALAMLSLSIMADLLLGDECS